MIFPEKLQIIRKNKGITQEELAEKLQVSRQAVAKWESGQSYPDITNLIGLSQLLHVTIDYLVKDDDCSQSPHSTTKTDTEELIKFLLEAHQNTYAGNGIQSPSCRPCSCDYKYEQGHYLYIDSYVGGERFSGEEVVWKSGEPIFSMNYSGRILDSSFSSSFLKEALRHGTKESPFRGPVFYQAGEYIYQSKFHGDIDWFQGYEEIYLSTQKRIFECYYHGGIVK